MIRTLAGVALLSGLLIVTIYQWTLPTIQAKKGRALRRAVQEVIPDAERFATYQVDAEGRMVLSKEGGGGRFYVGYDASGRIAGVAIEAAGQGFQDVIRLIYGYLPAEEIIVGMKVLESKETPGLGDRIEKDPEFLSNFEALDVRLSADRSRLEHPIETVKPGRKVHPWQIDTITGATISSKAVGRILNRSAAENLPVLVRNLPRLEGGEG